jgi:multisubunit Na+/H+ antiporter MnhE subunit
MPAAAGPRIAVTFLVALAVWIGLVAATGELNVASVVLGVLLSALLVWWGEKRREIRKKP